jgi:LacI family transcriptional regulator
MPRRPSPPTTEPDPASGEVAPRRRKAATIRDVAQAAGVSTATVSKFINGGQRFTREVEERVSHAIRELGYSSNPMARGMITGRTGNVGIVILDILNPHFTSIVKGASRVAAQAGLNLLFADLAEGQMPELAMLQALSRRVDGLIVSARLSDATIGWLQQSGLPAVYYGGRPAQAGCRSVGTDSRAAGLMLGRHLREQGHRRIAYVGYPVARWSADRWQGLVDAFAGSDARLVQHAVDEAVAGEGERIASSVLLGAEPPDAVVAYNDLLALGLLGQSHALGLPVPQAVSIAGFDDILYARYAFPALTTVDMGGERMGEVAMRRLAERIQDPDAPAGHDDLAPRLQVRATTRRRA